MRRRRWIRSRVKKIEKPKEGGTSTAPASTSSSPVFNRPSGVLAQGDTDGHSQSSFTSTSRPNLNKVSATSSIGTGPIFSHPSGVHDANASFTTQRSAVGAGGLGSPQGLEGVSRRDLSQPDMRGSSYMNLSDVRHGLSSECGKWGNSVASELQKALSSVGEGEALLVASPLHVTPELMSY